LVISLLSPTGTVCAAGGGQIVGCTFAALQTTLRAGGNWFYAAHQCPNPILFTGTITMGRNTTLIAQGQDITLSGGGKRRLFHVTGGVLALTGITIGDGHAKASDGDGGAIVIDPHAGLTLDHCTLSHNSTSAGADAGSPGSTGSVGGNGGAIFNNGGGVTITNSVLSDNRTGTGGIGGASSGAPDDSNAVPAGSGGTGGAGGAIDSTGGRLTISNSMISGNRTGAGGVIFMTGDRLTITNSTLIGNHTGVGGAGGTSCSSPDSPDFPGGAGGQGGQGGAIVTTAIVATVVTSTLSTNNTGGGGSGRTRSQDALPQFG
jgi:hypothetical protein